MKKLREVRFDDRSKLLLATAVAVLLLITAMLLPLAFRSAQEAPVPASPAATADEKRRVFADYWILGAEDSGIAVTKPETVEPATEEACDQRMQTLVDRFVDDRELHYEAPTGSEYTVICDERGTEVQLCRMWLQAKGDWQNWLDVCFDVDSGEIYYVYLSRECLANRSRYASKATVDAADVVAVMAEEYGWTLRWLDEGTEGSTALFTADGGTACYQIDCRSYDALLDVKVCCR